MDNPVAIFVGENGTGKSTPPEAAAVAYGLNTEGGAKRFNFSANATQGLFCKAIPEESTLRTRQCFNKRNPSVRVRLSRFDCPSLRFSLHSAT